MSRSLGWTLLTTRSPIEIVPEVMFSSPASILSKVDLPQPDGPTSTTNSPSSIGMDTPCRTSKLPNDLRTSRIWTDDIHFPPEKFPGDARRVPRPPDSSSHFSCSCFLGRPPSRRSPAEQVVIVGSLYGFGNRSISNRLVALST